MRQLSRPQEKFLRKKSHAIKPIFQMGKAGLSEEFITQVDQALEKRELIKFNLLQNTSEDVKDVAQKIAESTDAAIVHIVGHTAILYRPSSTQKYQVISQELPH